MAEEQEFVRSLGLINYKAGRGSVQSAILNFSCTVLKKKPVSKILFWYPSKGN